MKFTSIMVLFIAICTFGCNPAGEKHDAVHQLLDVDTEFSDRSAEVGMRQAFLEYASEEAVLLRPGSDPIVGQESIRRYLSNTDDNKFRLTWQPLRAFASGSEDMGYTYGIYTFTQDTIEQQGTYTSIWVKDQSGQWKFSLDTGNPGLSD